MEADVFTPFVEDGRITLVLERNHANFQTASDIAGIIRQTYFQQNPDDIQAVNASNIVMKVPDIYVKDPVDFISSLLDMQSYTPEPEARVVINERTGSIVISGDVQIGDVVVSHKNIMVDATVQVPPFRALDHQEGGDSAKLTALVDALTALKVPNADAIDIIKNIERSGKLHGRLIIE
jgi:flagellar P-ring protein precursor FlgI